MSDSSSTYPLLSPYLAVREASQAIEFYTSAFGACERFRLEMQRRWNDACANNA